MRILHTTFSYPPIKCGIPEVLRQLSERLAKRGHEVHVATGAVKGTPRTEVRSGVTVHRFDVQGNLVDGISGEINDYIDFVRSRQWDVIASHCAQIWSTDLLFEIQMDTPLVFVAHGLMYKNYVFRDYYARLAEWLRKKKTIVSLSSVGIDDGAFRRDYSLPEAVIIPNGVDIGEWDTPVLGVRRAWGREDEPWLLNVSAHTPLKSHKLLFELMKELRANNSLMHLTQIGYSFPARKMSLGKIGVRGGCYYQCKVRAQFEKSISMMLNISRAETISAVKEADLMVLTSSWEASPLVLLESMAAGTPFVTFDTGCVREHVGGRVVSSLSEMAQTVIELMADADLRRDLGQQGKKRIAERHDWEVVVDAYEHLYKRLTSEAKRQEALRV
jgi:glycosyltransferase involved in cell wall biosynthesis